MPLDQVDVDEMDGKNEMSFLEHLEELRWHIVRSVAVILTLSIGIFIAKDFVFNNIINGPRNDNFPTYRLACWFGDLIGMGEKLCIIAPKFDTIGVDFGETFLLHIKATFVLGFIAAFPYILYEVWRFIKPGLYKDERKGARGLVFICSILFMMGCSFGYYIISPFAVNFLANYSLPGVVNTPRISSYVNYMIMFTLPTGLTFEMPIIVYYLSRIGLVSPDGMKKYRRHAFVLIFILAALITPPDVVTQFLIGVPLYILYEISITISKRVYKKQAKEEAA